MKYIYGFCIINRKYGFWVDTSNLGTWTLRETLRVQLNTGPAVLAVSRGFQSQFKYS